MTIAIIPARGGSKRIPRKNVRLFAGQPMISWPLRMALASGLFERVLVSTDDAEIASVAREEGAEVPFIRPDSLAHDMAATVPVIQHAISELRLPGHELICCLYPTAVFTTADDLREAVQQLQATSADFVMPVTAYTYPLSRALSLDSTGRLAMKAPEYLNSRTQDCDSYYHDVGQFYLGTAAAWMSEKPFYEQMVQGMTIPRYRAHDIDTPDDWQLAEVLFRHLPGLMKTVK
ncbi:MULTISPECIES: pseudaminic acid cytidylyltransferase [Alkalimonas]|uniref:Pseudaminic acid cytidylyltransferase n=2 Tax=Alkalimonas TaxID=265980 RepID=A0ABU7J3Y9_9GAMM|nr:MULTISPECIES: pseudaminic acid cytidylyltransferase [unclassified Alkalimonas]MEE2001199.1 pseudaminic acid cytidylyltransferase [Alkalimonas sp. MEB108]MEE2025820.1 pseudaminic acid cytidylyltransferase [Alkalimonas sp. MEB004]